MFEMLCTLLNCYYMFTIDKSTNATCGRRMKALTIDQVMDFFDMWNQTDKGNGVITTMVIGRQSNYTAIMQQPTPSAPSYKRLILVNRSIIHDYTHQTCYYKKPTSSSSLSSTLTFLNIWMLLSAIVILLVFAINRGVKRFVTSSSSPPQSSDTVHSRTWVPFLSTLRRFNMVPQNDSS